MKTKRTYKTRKARCWVITRECCFKGRPHEMVICLLPGRFQSRRVADAVLALHHAMGSDFCNKHHFARSSSEEREKDLQSLYDRVSINANPCTRAVLASDVQVETDDSGFVQTVRWTDPDLYRFEHGKTPMKESDGRKRQQLANFRKGVNAGTELMVWGLPC